MKNHNWAIFQTWLQYVLRDMPLKRYVTVYLCVCTLYDRTGRTLQCQIRVHLFCVFVTIMISVIILSLPPHPFELSFFWPLECCEAYERSTPVHHATGIAPLPLFACHFKEWNTLTYFIHIVCIVTYCSVSPLYTLSTPSPPPITFVHF